MYQERLVLSCNGDTQEVKKLKLIPNNSTLQSVSTEYEKYIARFFKLHR